MEYVKIVLKSGKADAVRRFHPWIFSGAIKKIYGNVKEGDIVEVYSNKDEYLATGHYQNSSIAIRIFSFEEIIPDFDFWRKKIENAYELRKDIGLINNSETNVYRLVFAEGDGLSGLIIDYYNGTAVIQAHSIGMYNLRNEFAKVLKDIYKDELKAVYDKSAEAKLNKVETTIEEKYLIGEKSEDVVVENGSKFQIDWEKGQKTGFFVDQRFNRYLVSRYAKDRNVLNMYCYTGGFSIYALKAGAKLVHSIDSSAKATDLVDKNVSLNNFDDGRHQSFTVDAMDYLKEMDEEYDMIILDPPAFAKSHNVRHNAVVGYKRLNALAFKKIKSGGILFTFSCSQVVDRRLFNSTVISAAIQAGRKIRILQELSQPVDHPVNAFHPEGSYLKGLVLYIE